MGLHRNLFHDYLNEMGGSTLSNVKAYYNDWDSKTLIKRNCLRTEQAIQKLEHTNAVTEFLMKCFIL